MIIEGNVLKKVNKEDVVDGVVVIPEGVTDIGVEAFLFVDNMVEVKIPESVKHIGRSAFGGCSALSKITLPKGLTVLGASVFEGCESLTSIDIPEKINYIPPYTFRRCESLTSINMPETIDRIGTNAFENCYELTNIHIPKSVTKIDSSAFMECTSLASINIPEGVTEIESLTFLGCRSLNSISLPEGITDIGTRAFGKCANLNSINIPNGVLNIGREAFEKCSKLSSIQLPDGVVNIDQYAFLDCNGLIDINIPSGVNTINMGTFQNCTKLKNVELPEGITYIGQYAFYGCTGLSNIKIPDSVTSIDYQAFAECKKLSALHIPSSVTEIEDGAFYNCESLTNINIPDGVNAIARFMFYGCKSLTDVRIPQNVTSIGYSAFEGCEGLTSVNIPEVVTSIGEGTFRGCSSLKNFNIPQNVTSIGNSAFSGCEKLKSIDIPEGVISIGNQAFYQCYRLESITIPGTLTNVGSVVFKKCDIVDVSISEDYYKNEEALFELYYEIYNEKLKKLMFGENLEKFKQIRKQAHFHLSYEYENVFMDQLYHKVIYSVGLDELEKMVKIPGLDTDQIARYEEAFKRKEEIFKNLYEEKQVLNGDFGTVTSILKELALSINNDENRKKTDELDILREINLLLENSDSKVTSLQELISIAMQNAGYDSSKIVYNIEELQRALNKSQFQSNMNTVREDILKALASNDISFGEQLAPLQVEAIEKIIEDKLRKIYMANSKVSTENLKEELLEELTDSSHSIYIQRNANNIASRFLNLLDNNEDVKEKINHNSVKALRNIKGQIGGRWIDSIKKAFKAACDGQNIESIPDEFSIDQISILKDKLNIDIKTSQKAVVKKGADRDKAYKLLEDVQGSMPEEERLIVTYKQLHDMFGGVHYPYSEEFKKFFKEHREEFLRNPKYIYEFATICNNFESIINSPELKNIYLNGRLELDDILGYLGGLAYENQRPGDERLVKLSSSIGKIVTKEQFAEVQNVFDIVKNRERTSIPPVYVKEQNSKFRGRMLSPNDILTMFAGNITDCCQKFGDVGMGAMLLGAIEENAGIFVVEELQENGSYQIVGQSLTIRQKGKDGNYDRLTFDNVEITKNVKARLSKADQNEILAIYQEAGKQAMNLDRKFLQQLLKEGKISQEDVDNLVLKEAIAGRGYNDLDVLNSLQEAQTIVPDEAYYRYRSKEWGEKKPWIDSTQTGAPTGSNSYKPVIIAEMEAERLDKINSRRMKSNKKISNLTNIPLWYGKVDEPEELAGDRIKEQDIEIMKSIERKVYRPNQQLMNNGQVREYRDLRYAYEVENLSVVMGSQKNWYMIYGIGEKGECKIQDIALEGGLNSGKNVESKEKQNKSRLATVEMANEVYSLMIKNAKEGIKIVCNATKDTSLINIKNMIKKGIADVCDKNGKKIIISSSGELTYENGDEVSYREFESKVKDDESIKMLDLEIKPNIDKMLEEKIKLESYLQMARKMARMKPIEKEKGIDDMRRAIRDDL